MDFNAGFNVIADFRVTIILGLNVSGEKYVIIRYAKVYDPHLVVRIRRDFRLNQGFKAGSGMLMILSNYSVYL